MISLIRFVRREKIGLSGEIEMEQFNNFEYLKNDSDLIGRDEEMKEILYRIASGNMLLIEGEKGVGKSALLKYAIDNFKGKGKVVYVDVGTFGKRLDIAKLLKGRPKEMVLLVDNIQLLSESNNKKIKYFYDQDYIKSVVFTTADYSAVNFTDAIRSRIGRNIMKLDSLDQDQALEIVKGKLDYDFVIPDSVLDWLYKKTDNLKMFLANCDLLCGHLRREGEGVAKESDAVKILRKDLEGDEIEVCLECNRKLVYVGKSWRCESCDKYCKGCGVLYDDDDVKCPECGAEIEEESR